MAKRINFFLAGSSGEGIDSSGEILMHALAHLGYRATADREFPSLIKGGQSAFKISVADERIRGGSDAFDLGVCFGKVGIEYGLEHLSAGAWLIHDFERRAYWDPDFNIKAQQAGIKVLYVPTRETIKDLGVHTIFENSIVIGAVAHALGIDQATMTQAMQQRYGKKKALREMNKTCLDRGYAVISQPLMQLPQVTAYDGERIIVDGNTALALGAIHAGVRNYYAYPMSPSSSILGYFAKTAEQTGIVVKQAEDEITAIQLNIGSMYAGSRALTATSGGGFDLMTESISLAGMLEVPCVCVIAQRPGPATGLPTWNAQADLNLAIHGGHGEFARLVVAASDQESAFELIQETFNYAEEYQIPAVFLTEKTIAENRQTIPQLQQNTVGVERFLASGELESSDRYKITESGISTRWIPGSSETTFFCNGDEHYEDGTLDESPDTQHMISKRIRKLEYLKTALPDPVIYGDPVGADISFIGWGSTKGAVLDMISQYETEGLKINYLHFDWLWPLKTEVLRDFIDENTHLCVVENNATGQLHQLIKQQTGIDIPHTLLKYNGRPITAQDIQDYVSTLLAAHNS